MKLSKEQKEEVIAKISLPWGMAHLLCDGYRISLSVERDKGLSYRVMTYINGHFKGTWCNVENECPEQKFLRKSVRRICSPPYKQKMEKLLGKRHVAKDPFYTRTFTCYMPDWSSGKAAINHLCKVCDSVQVVEPEESVFQEAP